MPDDHDLSYRLDNQDRIIEVGGDWDRIARENDGGEVVAERVLGTTLYTHVSDGPGRMFVWTMLDSVRKLFRPSTKLYRCDSPDCKRQMEMTILPQSGGGLLVQHRTIKIEPLAPRVRYVGQAWQRSSGLRGGLVLRCSMCVKLKIDGVWYEPEVAIRAGLIEPGGIAKVAYGVCEHCSEVARRPPMNR
jgi:hypothetical protein